MTLTSSSPTIANIHTRYFSRGISKQSRKTICQGETSLYFLFLKTDYPQVRKIRFPLAVIQYLPELRLSQRVFVEASVAGGGLGGGVRAADAVTDPTISTPAV